MIGRRGDGIMAAERTQEPDSAMAQWYYSDEERNRHGPLDAAAMIELHRRGELGPDTLVWRDGLSLWRPWRELAGELVDTPGFAAAADPAQAEQAGAERTAAAVAAAMAQAEATQAGAPAQPAPAQPAPTQTDAPAADPAAAYAAPADAAAASSEPGSPYAAPRATVAESSQTVQGHEVVPAGFWRRAAAYLIDSTLVGIAYYTVFTALFVAAMVLGFMGGGGDTNWLSNSTALSLGLTAISYVLYWIFSAAYYAGLESSSMQATLGKLAVGIKVVDGNGERLSRGRALGRWASSLVSYATFGVGYLMIAFTERKRGLHDMIAGTLVVDRWAYTARPEQQRRDLGPVAWVVLILGGLIWLAVTGFLVVAVLVGMGKW